MANSDASLLFDPFHPFDSKAEIIGNTLQRAANLLALKAAVEVP